MTLVRNRDLVLGSLLMLVLATLGVIAMAGPLDPPAGPVSPSYKTVTEIEPRIAISSANTPGDADSIFKISEPGSYYLTSNVIGVAGKHGIKIAASGVTVDLRGFDLLGVSGMGAFDGVTASAVQDVTVRNGSIRSWGNSGISLAGISSSRVEEIIATGNGNHGVVAGSNSLVVSCVAQSNGVHGISIGDSSVVSASAASNNTFDGIRTGDSCTVSNCAVRNNGGRGIRATGRVCDCMSLGNAGIGIDISAGSTAQGCSADGNLSEGINADSDCLLVENSIWRNRLDGIKCGSSCVVLRNTCSGNGASPGNGASIHATGSDNRVEGNNCVGADRGIDVDSAGNIIIKNTCSGNTLNWDIVAGNVCLVVNATTAGAISGNSGGAAPGSTDPSANFTY